MPDLSYERSAWADGRTHVAGLDEVGRGPLAGPVVAAAVILGPLPPARLDDSKRLSPTAREKLFDEIVAGSIVSIAASSARCVDRINIREASLVAMERAAGSLTVAPDWHLIDGNVAPTSLASRSECIVKGDGRSCSIAAASIVAKVVRDRLMVRSARLWPGYGFDVHKGYPTKAHKAAIALVGPCSLHRMSFGPLRGLKLG